MHCARMTGYASFSFDVDPGEMSAVPKYAQLVVRLDESLLERLGRASAGKKSELVRTALLRYLDDEHPEPGQAVGAIKTVYLNAVKTAFADEGQIWTPLSAAFFCELDPAFARGKDGATEVWIQRPGFSSTNTPRGLLTGDIEWRHEVNTPTELRKLLRYHLNRLSHGGFWFGSEPNAGDDWNESGPARDPDEGDDE
jgi:hypothetical protein